jgi:hypothetical protein
MLCISSHATCPCHEVAAGELMTTQTQIPGNNPAIQTSPVREIETVDAIAPTLPESCHLCCDFSDPQRRDEHSFHLAVELISK